MSKNCIVSIRGLQTYSDSNSDTDIELLTEGEFFFDDGVYFCKYKESEITGLDGTDTTIEIGDNYVALNRCGSVNSQMLFMPGRKTSSLYSTKYGELLVDIYTDSLKSDVGKDGGSICVDYIIDINNSTTGRNNFEINIKEAN